MMTLPPKATSQALSSLYFSLRLSASLLDVAYCGVLRLSSDRCVATSRRLVATFKILASRRTFAIVFLLSYSIIPAFGPIADFFRQALSPHRSFSLSVLRLTAKRLFSRAYYQYVTKPLRFTTLFIATQSIAADSPAIHFKRFVVARFQSSSAPRRIC